MSPILDSAAKSTRSLTEGQPARFKEERAARMDGHHAVHAGVASSRHHPGPVHDGRCDGILDRLMMAGRRLPRLFGTGDQSATPPLAYAAGGIGCLTDYFRPAALSTLRPARAAGRRFRFAALLALAPVLFGFAPFGSPGETSFLLDVRPGAQAQGTPFEASFSAQAAFDAGEGSQFGAQGAVVSIPVQFTTDAGDSFDGLLTIDWDVSAVTGGQRELQVPSESATAKLKKNSPTSPATVFVKSGWIRFVSIVVSSAGRSSAVRATFELSFAIPGPVGGEMGETAYQFSEASFASNPAPEDLAVGTTGGGSTVGQTNVNVGVGVNVSTDTGCGGDSTPDGTAPADSCAGDTSDGADACSGDAPSGGGCDCAGDAHASTLGGAHPRLVKAHPLNRLVSRYLPFFAIWVFIQGAKAAVRYRRERDK